MSGAVAKWFSAVSWRYRADSPKSAGKLSQSGRVVMAKCRQCLAITWNPEVRVVWRNVQEPGGRQGEIARIEARASILTTV
jgi:hypothetical protein